MFSRSAPRLLRLTSRTVPIRTPQSLPALALARSSRPFHISAPRAKGIQPDSENPRAPNPQSGSVAGAGLHVNEPSPLTPEEYQDYSEHYFNVLIAELEKSQEEGSDVEAEYSVSSFQSFFALNGWFLWSCSWTGALSFDLLRTGTDDLNDLHAGWSP